MSSNHRSLSAKEQQLLDRYSGTRRSWEALRAARVLTAERTDLFWRSAKTADDVATMLRITVEEVFDLERAGALYAILDPVSNDFRFPSWQFVDGLPTPHAGTVAAALPAAHPLAVEAFFIHALIQDPKNSAADPVNAVTWLRQGKSAKAVLTLAVTEEWGP